MKRAMLPVLMIVAGVTLCSCSQMQQQQQAEAPQEQKEKTPPPLYLGSVHQVFAADKFALVRVIGPRPEEGTVLISHPENGSIARVGNLVVSSSQHARNNIIAVDIRAGQVMKGDRVFKYRTIAAETEEEETEEEQYTPEQLTISGDDMDLGYVPPEVKARRERLAQQAAQAEAAAADAPFADIEAPEPETTSTTEESGTSQPAIPDIPVPEGLPRLDEVPDDISGWDSM